MNELAAWILAIMTTWSPPTRTHYIPEAMESHDQARSRYAEIAQAIVDGVEGEKLLYGGKHGKAKTVMFVAYVWWQESGFRRDVDLGLGRERLAKQGYNDYGKSWCMGQLNLGKRRFRVDGSDEASTRWRWDSARKTVEGYSGRELLENRELCAKATLGAMRRSILTCRKLPRNERLAAYHSGKCEKPRGRKLSRIRYRLFWRQLAKHPPPVLAARDLELLPIAKK